MIPLKLVLLLLIVSSSRPAVALEAPDLVGASISAGGVITLEYGIVTNIDAINIYKDEQYLSTIATQRSEIAGELQILGSTGRYCLVAVRGSGANAQYSDCSNSLVPQLSVVRLPGVGSLRAERYSATAAELFWDRSTVSQNIKITTFQIFRNNQLVGRVDGTSYFDDTLAAGQDYRYEVIGLTADGVMTDASVVEIGAWTVTGAPEPPISVSATRYSATAGEVSWARSRSANVVAYRIYRNGTRLDQRDALSYFDDDLSPSTAYRYEIAAVVASGAESVRQPVAMPALHNEQAPSPGAQRLDPPQNFRIQFYSENVAELFWDEPVNFSGSEQFVLFGNGEQIALTTGRSYFLPAIDSTVPTVFSLISLDSEGNRSSPVELRVGGDGPETNDNAAFSIKTMQSRWVLTEGAGSISIPIQVVRREDHQRAIRFSTEFDSDAHALNMGLLFDRQVVTTEQSQVLLAISLELDMGPLLTHQRDLTIVASDGMQEQRWQLQLDVVPVDAPDVYLLIGQSNMEGYSEEGAKAHGPGGPDATHPRILQLNVLPSSRGVYRDSADFTDQSLNRLDPLFILAEDPLHEPKAPWETEKGATRVGLGLSFAKQMLPATTQEIVLVPAAWSASGFCRNDVWSEAWNAYGTPVPELGGSSLLDRALTRLNITLEETGGILRGILWHQGEADSNTDACAYSYRENLQKMVQRIKREARQDKRGATARGDDGHIPLIVGTMSRGDDERGNFSWFGVTTKFEVDQVHRSIEDAIEWADWVNADDLVPPQYPCGTGSCVHFGSAAYRELGVRYAQALQRVVSRYRDGFSTQ